MPLPVKPALILVAGLSLTACTNSGYPTNDADRAAIGAATLGGAALLRGDSNRAVAGAALVGGAAGALCDDAGICQ